MNHLSPLASRLLQDCARPDPSNDPASLRQAIISRTRHAVGRLFEIDDGAVGDALDGQTVGYLDQAISLLPSLQARLTPGLHAFEAARTPSECIVALLCWFATLGVPGTWRVPVGGEQRVFIGAVPVAVAGDTTATVGDERIELRSVLGTAVFARLGPARWSLLREAHQVDSAHGLVVFHRLNPSHTSGFAEHLPLTAATDAPARIAAALELIRASAPWIHAWVDEALCGVIAVDTIDQNVSSGSTREYPGLMFVTHAIDVETLAVLIVHEVAHNYYYALAQHVRLVDPASAETIYSPFRKMDRPVEKVLIAFHAAANIVRHTQARLRAGSSAGALLHEHRTTLEYYKSMHADLSRCTTLTAAGRDFMGSTAAGVADLSS